MPLYLTQNDHPSFSASSVKLQHDIQHASHIFGMFFGEFLFSSVITEILYLMAVVIKKASAEDFIFAKLSKYGCSFIVIVMY